MSSARQFSMKEALKLLGIKPPKITKKMSQDDIDKMVVDWKENELTAHYKKERAKAHPDKHPDDAGAATKRFQNLGVAYDEVKEHLKLRKPKVPPAEVTHCRKCNTSRQPKTAIHCHACGARYELEKPRTVCPLCRCERVPSGAKFCHGCGYDYQVPDALIERLVGMGFRPDEIDKLENDGTLSRWRKLNPFNPHLTQAIKDKLHMTKIMRKMGRFT